jgi:hypothetical protein
MNLLSVCGKYIRVDGRLIRIARLDADKYEFLSDPATVVDGLRTCGERIDLFTFLERLPDDLQERAASTPIFNYPAECDNLAVLPVTSFDNWWTKQISAEARNRARQAPKKGVVIREVPFDDVLVQGICEIYNESPVRQGRSFPHYGKDISTVRNEAATYLNRSIFIGAFLGDKLIGFVKLVTDEGKSQANLMNILSLIQHRDKAPTNALIAQAVRACAGRSIPFLLYQSFSYGKKRPDGTSRFKEVNGFKRINLPRYYVPLTVLGKAAFRVGLHHKFVDQLPESVGARLRDIQNAWYNRKYQVTKKAS